jgi:hypothetical protein
MAPVQMPALALLLAQDLARDMALAQLLVLTTITLLHQALASIPLETVQALGRHQELAIAFGLDLDLAMIPTKTSPLSHAMLPAETSHLRHVMLPAETLHLSRAMLPAETLHLSRAMLPETSHLPNLFAT